MGDSCPNPPHNPLATLKAEPTLHYVLTCAFLFFIFMCATLLESLVGFNLRIFMAKHEWPKHALAFLLLFFTIGSLNDMPDWRITVLSTVLVYAWFIVITKLPGCWSMSIFGLLGLAFILNEAVDKHYTPEWIYNVPKHSSAWTGKHWYKKEARIHPHSVRVETRKKVRKILIDISWGVGITSLILTVLLAIWFYSSTRQHMLAHPPANPSALWTFGFQPDAFQPKPWAFSSQSLKMEEKYELDVIVEAVLKKLKPQLAGQAPQAN